MIEVLAATFLLGSVSVALVLSGSRLEEQAREATGRLQALEVLEGLVEASWEDLSQLEDPADSIPDGYRLETRRRRETAGHDLEFEILELDLFLEESAVGSEPMARLELCLELVPARRMGTP